MEKMKSVVPAFLVLLLSVLATGIAAKAVHREVSSVEQRQFQTEAVAVKAAIAEFDAKLRTRFACRYGSL